MFTGKDKRREQDCQDSSAFILAILYTIGFFGFVFCQFVFTIPDGNQDVVKQLVPIMSAIQLGIINFFYQKSQQEREAKSNETIKQLATTATTAAAAVVSNSVPINPTVIPPVPADTNTGTMNVTSDSVIVNETEKK